MRRSTIASSFGEISPCVSTGGRLAKGWVWVPTFLLRHEAWKVGWIFEVASSLRQYATLQFFVQPRKGRNTLERASYFCDGQRNVAGKVASGGTPTHPLQNFSESCVYLFEASFYFWLPLDFLSKSWESGLLFSITNELCCWLRSPGHRILAWGGG